MKPRKLILSRKGFDSTSKGGTYPYGGCPSPIFPDGSIYSLPIPSPGAKITYGSLNHEDINIGSVVEELTRNRKRGGYHPGDGVHLDPDVRADAVSRKKGWLGLFGQAGAAEGHLRNEGVDAGDVFLLFGLFQRVERRQHGWDFVRDTRPLHLLWGWLQVREARLVDEIRGDPAYSWSLYHDHFRGYNDPSNTLYIASENLDLEDGVAAPGAGVFQQFNQRLVLTRPQGSASQWRLPRWFYPGGDKQPLSYHPHNLWKADNDYAYVQRRGPGQEFVLDLAQYPEALGWLSGLISDLGAT